MFLLSSKSVRMERKFDFSMDAAAPAANANGSLETVFRKSLAPTSVRPEGHPGGRTFD